MLYRVTDDTVPAEYARAWRAMTPAEDDYLRPWWWSTGERAFTPTEYQRVVREVSATTRTDLIDRLAAEDRRDNPQPVWLEKVRGSRGPREGSRSWRVVQWARDRGWWTSKDAGELLGISSRDSAKLLSQLYIDMEILERREAIMPENKGAHFEYRLREGV